MSKRSNRSKKIIKLIPGLEVSKNIVMPGPKKKQKDIYYNCSSTKRTLRPRYNAPSYTSALANTSNDDSFMDICTNNEKDGDQTYIPVTDNDTVNSSYISNYLSNTLEDVSNCTEDLPLEGIICDLHSYEIHQIDQVAGNIVVGGTDHILADNSVNSIIENSDTSQNLELSQYEGNTYIPPSESEESYTENHTAMTSQALSPIQSTVPMSEISQYQDKIYFVPPIESLEPYLTNNYTVTSQSLLQSQTTTVPPTRDTLPTTTSRMADTDEPNSNIGYNSGAQTQDILLTTPDCVADTDEPNSNIGYNSGAQTQDILLTTPDCVADIDEPNSNIVYNSGAQTRATLPTTSGCMADIEEPNSNIGYNSGISEFDDSDRDEAYNPVSADSSSDTSYTEEIEGTEDTLTNTKCKILPRRHCYVKTSQESNTDEININESKEKKKRIRTKDYCFFCETDVLNFARHVIRNHVLECEVQKILSYPKKSCTRKNLLTNLRKKGNYIKNVTKCYKPMKKSNVYPDIDYLPCVKCLGFYSRKQLWKHKKKCQPLSDTVNTQVEAQNFMLRNLKIDKKLKNEVFPKMRPDKISLEAKKDALICAFGAQYLRIHREKHFINVTSRKMRELTKLLIELKKLKPSINDLMDSLKPQNYDLIVNATKKVSGYDSKTDCYSAPTYAMNISTSLKQCCNIAIMATLKSDSSLKTATIEADLKTLIHLIESNWKFDVSSQANSDLNMKKWNKITIVPLASDLKLLKNYLCEKAISAASKLAESENSNIEAYTTLMETIYCRIILLNRRRPGELQRLLLSTYQECHNGNNAYEEFDRAITSAEKILLQSFKRIVIRGKRGRGVPVLLTDEVQNNIDLLISVRRKYVSDKNRFLFATPNSDNTLCGYKVLEKYAKACGAKNPKAITTTKLRKHLATLTQMFNLKETDIEQLASFMGHTHAVHRQNYRLPDDVYQTAKLSKLLLLMEDGGADCYKGKSLDDIDLDLEQDLLQDVREDNDQNDDIVEYEAVMTTEEPNEKKNTVIVDKPKITQLRDVTNATITTTKKKRNLVPWTTQQKNIVKHFFRKHIKNKQPPKRHECDELRNLHPDILINKDWLKIKVFVQNTYTKENK